MRNPVGPLPSSIYWRRRAVAAVVIALLAALIGWAVTIAGGGDGKKDDPKSGGSRPAPSITPGPSSSGPIAGQPPGGRDESGATGGTGGSAEPGAASGGGADTGSGSGSDAGDGDTGSATTAGSGPGGGAEGVRVPAGSALPDCTPSALRLSLRTENSYGPDDRPRFRLIAENTSAADCKADLGPKNTVLTITEAGGDDAQVWSSKDCPSGTAPLYLRIPAGTTVVHTVVWNREKSAPQCATPAPGKAGTGTYLLEAKAPGEPLQRASFVLAKD
ncbi:MAG TPA: hypothetical protein VIS29_21300 [Streptomyces sp.]